MVMLSPDLSPITNDMCVHPLTIDNPFLGLSYLSDFKDTVSTRIQVPCGHCSQCIAARQGSFVQRVQMESLRSYIFYFTLTYNDESLRYVTYQGSSIPVPDISDMQNMLKRIRKKGHVFRVLYVSEYGKKRHRPHFHGLFFVPKYLITEYPFSSSIAKSHIRSAERLYYDLFFSEWKRDGKPLFTYHRDHRGFRNFDFHFVKPEVNHDNDTAFYITKYVTKHDVRTSGLLSKIALDTDLSSSDRTMLLDTIRPRCIASKDLGDWSYPPIREYIEKGLERTYETPTFYDLFSGKPMPLNRYYKRHLLTVDWMHKHIEDYGDISIYPHGNPDFLDDYDPSFEYYSYLNRGRDEEKLKKIRANICENLLD